MIRSDGRPTIAHYGVEPVTPKDELMELPEETILLGVMLGLMTRAEDGVYEFLFCGPALPFTNGAGTPINPLAVK